MIRDKDFYKTIFAIAIPIALQNLITFSVSLADTVMLSRAGATDELVSAADLANRFIFLLIMALIGLTGGGMALASQYWGKGDIAAIRKITAMILHMGFAISFFTGIILLAFPESVMGIFTKDAVIIERGAEYLSIVGWSCFLFGISFLLMNMLRSVEVVRFALFADITALCISVFLNWVLIFGNLGFPALGIRGAATSTLIARTVGFLIICVYVFVFDKKMKFRLKNIFVFDFPLFKDILKYGLPVLANQMAWATGVTVQAIIIGRIDYSVGDFVAANAAVSVIFQMFMVAMFGAGSAALIIIGKTIGAGEFAIAKEKAATLFKLAAIMGTFSCVTILLTRGAILKIF
ncbi:MAG: polysaccharide biosynthesis C-terminal domain-containing protein, partial [Clostridiales bacterium]|nr:polysaccharide biosynthesis C-terminal domain-containing protein [Clostridiales bacterium]